MTLADHTNAAARARAAYYADRAVEDGLCAVCKTRPLDGNRRRCHTCRKEGRVER